MGVNVRFTPIYGSRSRHRALSNVLSIDDFNILLDCGWTSSFDPQHLKNLAAIAPTIHAVLITHSDLNHIGALPYAVANFNLQAPIFSTLPVWRMGQMFMYDTYLSHTEQAPFTQFNLDHVDAAFEQHTPSGQTRYHLLKYQQNFPLDAFPNGAGLVITPHPAGHMLGGALWSITKHTETIVYAVHFNHRRERHLNPTTLPAFSRPSHLIMSSIRANTHTETSKPSYIIDHVHDALKRNGNVLIPVDTAGRVIELAIHMQDAWEKDAQLSPVPLVILYQLSSRTFDFARSMIEWMSDEVVKRFDISRDNLFIFKHIKLLHSMKELQAIQGPVVVLASSVSMDMGFSRNLFARWAVHPANSLILVDIPEPDTLYSTVYKHCQKSRAASDAGVPPFNVSLTMKRKEYLQGEELEQWRANERARKALEEEQDRKKKEQIRLAKEAEEKEKENAALALSSTHPDQTMEEAAENSLTLPGIPKESPEEAAHRYDKMTLAQLHTFGCFPSKPVAETFAFEQPTSRPSWDDYGQEIDTVRFMVGEDPGEGAPVQKSEFLKTDRAGVEEVDAVPEEIPTEYVEEQVNLTVTCHIAIVDCAGLSDGDSMKRLVKEVEPRHVTLIGGSEEETAHFEQYLLSNLFVPSTSVDTKVKSDAVSNTTVPSVVVIPKEMETLDITSNTTVFNFMLEDTLVEGLQWNKVNLSNVAFVDAMVTEHLDEEGRQILGQSAVLPDEPRDEMQVDGGGAITSKNAVLGHPTVFVGTIMLNRLKDKLIDAHLKAEFAGGALCVENPDTGVVVLLKKVGAQHITVEGALSEEYFAVKDILYEELVIPR